MEDNTIIRPFPGLRPFEEDEEHLFFGREKATTALLSRLRTSRFLAVIGASGSGKSSLVKAGVLPSLYRGFMAQVDSSWRVALFRPGDNPIGNLAESLTKAHLLCCAAVDDQDENAEQEDMRQNMIEATLRRSEKGLIETVKEARLPGSEKLLIVVDQFEELFRFSKLERSHQEERLESAAFVNLLLESVQQTGLPIYIILTMRSDFLGDCTEFRGLPEAINSGQYLIPRMTREQKRAAITGPIAVGGAEITPTLLARLLNDVGNSPDHLPILQHALMRTWEHWTEKRKEGELLDIHHYEVVGGMEKALSQHAEEAYAELKTKRKQTICEKMFKLLTEMGETGRGGRRPAKLSEICRVTDASEKEVSDVINGFRRPGRTFLMPPAEVELNADSVIDISHESFMRIWDRLIGWVKEEAESSELYLRLAKAAALHREGKAALWRAPELMWGLKWREDNRPNAVWAQRYDPSFDRAMEFLDASRKQRDREAAAKEREQRAKIRRIRVIAAIICMAAVISIFFGMWALNSKQKAEEALQTANEERQKAVKAEDQMKKEKNKAIEAQKQAEEEEEKAKKSEEGAKTQKRIAEENEQKAKINQEKAEEEERKAKKNEVIAKIQGYIVEMDQDRDNFHQYLAKANELAAHSLAESEDKELKALLALTAYRLNHEAYKKLDESTDKIHGEFKKIKLLDNPDIRDKEINLNRKHLELQTEAGNQRIPANIFEALREAYITKEEGKDILDEAESWALAVPGAGKVVFNDREGRLVLASIQSDHRKLARIEKTVDLSKNLRLHVSCLAVTKNRLFCGTREGDLVYWEGNNREILTQFHAHEAKILSMVFSTHANALVYSVKNKVYSCDFEADPRSLLEVDDSHYIRALVVIETTGNSILLTADEGGNIFQYDLVNKGKKKPLNSDFKAADFHAMVYKPSSKLLAAATSDGNVILFPGVNVESLTAGKEIKVYTLPKNHKGIVSALAISPDGKYLASTGFDGAVVLWDILQQDPLLSIQCKRKVLSLVFDSKGDYLIFNDEENLRICPTSPKVFYNILNKTKKRDFTGEEWNDYVGESIEQETMVKK